MLFTADFWAMQRAERGRREIYQIWAGLLYSQHIFFYRMLSKYEEPYLRHVSDAARTQESTDTT